MKPKVLAIVPARSGSKRLPGKNIRILNGIPLVAHTFNAIKDSEFITTTIVTSDCPKVLEISSHYNNMYQLNRPKYLASDTSTTIEVLLHALDHAKQLGEFDTVCLLQPTSPLRTTEDIDNAIHLYINKKAKGIVSMCKCEHSPLWTTTLETSNKFKKFIKSLDNKRSQDLEDFYKLNGAIYINEIETLIETKKIFHDKGFYPFIMSSENSIDIDTLLDFKMAELIIKERKC
jgi:CMP-N,N'-diacetyllegionaminic acid synthase